MSKILYDDPCLILQPIFLGPNPHNQQRIYNFLLSGDVRKNVGAYPAYQMNCSQQFLRVALYNEYLIYIRCTVLYMVGFYLNMNPLFNFLFYKIISIIRGFRAISSNTSSISTHVLSTHGYCDGCLAFSKPFRLFCIEKNKI